jgi:hypothetical protein
VAAVKGFEYFGVRCVPRVDREEFLNVGVVLYSQAAGFLGAAFEVDRVRLARLWPDLDLEAVCAALDAIEAVCRGDGAAGGRAATGTLTERFGWLAAPRSTVVQPGPVHGGLTDDPAGQLSHLLAALVG